MRKIIKGLIVSAAFLTVGFSCVNAQNYSDKNKEEYHKGMNVISSSLNLLNRYFVDSIDMKKTIRYGINSMLESLDPYTEYFSQEDAEKLKLITTGEYGGIGAIIAQTPDSVVYVNELMKDKPADKAGIKAGDVILKVDSVDFKKATSADVTEKLKGIAGTTLSILIKRYGDKNPRLIKLKREKIIIDPVPYYGITKNNIGYISLVSFTQSASDHVETALKELMKRNVNGIILDLRNNGGGLIDQAVKIVSFFVPEGSKVVYTKGRDQQETSSFQTTNKPIAGNIPLAVLINSASASASEIVSGALQDMDRAVIIGEKSFGKGLVQTTMRLPYEGVLKLTTSKYYIPSGRCIQKINYHDVREGKGESILPDSLTKVFYTTAGREVHDAGGIMPDIVSKGDSVATMILYLSTNKDVFDWVTKYYYEHKEIRSPIDFSITDKDYESFCNMAKSKNIDYDRASGKMLDKLIEVSKIEGYYEKNKDLFEQMKIKLTPTLDQDLINLKTQIVDFINKSIITRYYYSKGNIERSVQEDNVIRKATSIILDNAEYNRILSPQKKN